MKYPVAKIKRDREVGKKVKSVNKYLMYDDETKELEIMSDKDLLASHIEIKGFKFGANGPYVLAYYNNLGFIGEEEENKDGVNYFTVIKQIYYKDKTSFELVNKEGKLLEVDREQLIGMIKQGHQIAGVQLVIREKQYNDLLNKGWTDEEARMKTDILKVSSEMECKYINN